MGMRVYLSNRLMVGTFYRTFELVFVD